MSSDRDDVASDEAESSGVRISGTANDAGGIFERADLVIDGGTRFVLVLGVDDEPVGVELALPHPIELFDYRSPARFVPIASVSSVARAAKGQWFLLRDADGLSFRPDDLEHVRATFDELGLSIEATTRDAWPGEPSGESTAAGCVGAVVVVGLLVLATWLVSLTGLDFGGPWGRPVVALLYLVILVSLALAFGRRMQRRLRRSVRGPVDDEA